MEQIVGTQEQNYNSNSTSLHTSHRSTHIVSDKTKENPRAGDIWVLHFARSPNHFTRFFMPKIEVFFQASDKILKVKALGLSS